jgi:hypothetical protein
MASCRAFKSCQTELLDWSTRRLFWGILKARSRLRPVILVRGRLGPLQGVLLTVQRMLLEVYINCYYSSKSYRYSFYKYLSIIIIINYS